MYAHACMCVGGWDEYKNTCYSSITIDFTLDKNKICQNKQKGFRIPNLKKAGQDSYEVLHCHITPHKFLICLGLWRRHSEDKGFLMMTWWENELTNGQKSSQSDSARQGYVPLFKIKENTIILRKKRLCWETDL